MAATLVLPKISSKCITEGCKELFCPKFELEIELNSGSKWETNETHIVRFDFEPRDWQFSYIDYVLYGILLKEPKEAAMIRRKVASFYYNSEIWTLYSRSSDEILLRCLSKKETQEALKEAYSGIC